ncbi:hypothetical protein HAALTHF_28820n [Vreelandella aquamarina]|nr:hypothetical protein HAALTHF_28820n [Halomonas axialensis]
MKRRHFLGLAGLTGLAGVLPGVSFGFPRLDLEAAPDLGAARRGVEAAFSSPLDKQYDEGAYHCAGCDLLLFTSAMKYDPGTGLRWCNNGVVLRFVPA